jgi:hypothetical protein
MLEFHGGFPTEQTLQTLYDQLDFQRGCQVFLRHLMAAAIWGFQQAFTRDLDMGPTDLLIMHADANGLALTANSETIYAVAMIDTKPGPVVLDVPPNVLGFLNDQWMRPMGDLGIVGPDRGAGGRYLLVPPGYEGDLPTEGFVGTLRLRTYRQWLVLRAFMGPGGDPAPAFETLRGTRIAPLADGGDAAPTQHIDGTGRSFDTIHPTDIRYFEDLAAMVEYEPADAISLDEAAELAQIGIEKGKPFAPDERMRAILDEAARIGSYQAFAITNAPRQDPRRTPDRQWFNPPVGYPSFVDDRGRPMIDEMVSMAWFATGRATAMAGAKPGVGSAYTWAYRDANGDWIDPARTYRLRLPGPIPAKDFWSVVLYDPQTRSELQTPQPYPSKNNKRDKLITNADGSVDLYFGPNAPAGKEANWTATVPGKGWFAVFRLYGPLDPWFDKQWQPGEVKLVN